VYYYNTATAFAEEPLYAVHAPPETSQETETQHTVASISEQRRARSQPQRSNPSSQTQSATVAVVPDGEMAAPGSPGALEEEASEQGAFNEETGEINWDCPCLGGMATGPCGDQFKAAFSCFVYSKEEPKGVECIEHFKTMQNCFREHPDVYGNELDDDDAPPAEDVQGQPAPHEINAPQDSSPTAPASGTAKQAEEERVSAATEQVRQDHGPVSESDEAVPKAWHDTRDASTDK